MSPGLIAFLAIMALVIVLCFYMAVKTSRAKKQGKKLAKEMAEKAANHFAEIEASESIALNHTAGLLLPENTLSTLFLLPAKLRIEANGVGFDLALDRVTAICIKTDVDIQKQLVSSAGGAVAGGIMFGAVGALIGGRAKTKKITEIKRYLIISYIKDDSADYIAFDVGLQLKDAAKFVDAVQAALPKQATTVTL